MKILTKEEADEHYNVVLKSGAKGFAASAAIALPVSYYLNRTWSYYRRLPISLKAFGVIVATVPTAVIVAEKDSLAWEAQRWTDVGKHEIDLQTQQEQQRVAQLEGKEKIQDWITRRRYSIVGVGWATSMAVAMSIISRNKFQTFPQKIVQARMWAQGLTVGLLVASAGLATTDKTPQYRKVDHSWADIIAEQEREAQHSHDDHPGPASTSPQHDSSHP